MTNPAGLFIWVDLATPDPGAAAAFYEAVLGWSAEQSSPDPEMPYWNLSHGDKVAAGMGRLSEEQVAKGMPSVWTSYIKVDDCDAAVARATELGGSVIMRAMQIFDVGKMAMLADPTGAAFAVWESGTFDGADHFNDPGFFSWNELATRDVLVATAFYQGLFGWDLEEFPMGEDGGIYTVWKIGDRENGAMYDATAMLPPEVPSHWSVYLSVADCDDAAAKIKEAGGTLIQEPFDMQEGRKAVAQDPFGAAFMLIQMPSGS
jgi:predicted enzyme related to lactoylglutathione lyase